MNNNIFFEAITSLKVGMTIKNLAEQFNITMDQAKKISQISNMQDAIVSLEPKLQEKFISLGYKALVLNPLFKNNDIEGIKEILESIDVTIKRDDLKVLPEALKIKRERLAHAKVRAKNAIIDLERIEEDIENHIKDVEANKKKIDESMQFLSDVKDQMAKEFLMEHLGVAKGMIVLYKRLDISWQQSLKRSGTIRYNKSTFTWEVIDLNELKRQVERRIKNKYNMYYNPDKASGMYAEYYPDNPEYKNAHGLDFSIMDAIKNNEQQIRELKKKKREVNKNLKELKGTKVQTYIESMEISNQLSQYEILAHRKLQNVAMKYLYSFDQVAATEISLENYRFDVVGYDQYNQVTIIEAKASIEDFRSDNKFHKYIKYCNVMYFIFEEYIFNKYRDEIEKKINPYNIGSLIMKKDSAIVNTISGDWEMEQNDKHDLMFNINRALSRKFIYGR